MADQLIKIPEFILFDLLNKAIEYIRNDYEAQSDKDKSFLMKVLKGNAIERYDLQKQAVQVFIDNNPENQRYLETNLMFNMEREGMPTIHLTLPSEQTQSGGNGIGSDEGYQDSIIEDTEYNEAGEMTFQGQITPVFTRRFQSTYNVVITSDNSNEVILIYHTLRALFISLIPSMHLAGLENVAFGGQDVQLYQGLAPKNMYIRAITVTLQYETSSPNIFSQPMFHDITARGRIIKDY
jgi:hypothetical protein